MTDLMSSIIQTHNPTWPDCRQLLLTLFNTEKRHHITHGTLKYLEEHADATATHPAQWAQQAFPNANPMSDPNGTGLVPLRYQQALIEGMKMGIQRPMNLSKISEILQCPDESPRQFYERLCEAYCLYTPFDPEATENQRTVNTSFVSQAQSNIRRKLQHLEGFAGMNISHPVDGNCYESVCYD